LSGYAKVADSSITSSLCDWPTAM